MEECKVEGCSFLVKARGLCLNHLEKDNLYIERVLGFPREIAKKEIKKKCKIDGCDEKELYRSLCKKHYRVYLKDIKNKRKCTVDGCSNGQTNNGYCKTHYSHYTALRKKAIELSYAKNYYVLDFEINNKIKRKSFEKWEEYLAFDSKMITNVQYKEIELNKYTITGMGISVKNKTIEYFQKVIDIRESVISRLLKKHNIKV